MATKVNDLFAYHFLPKSLEESFGLRSSRGRNRTLAILCKVIGNSVMNPTLKSEVELQRDFDRLCFAPGLCLRCAHIVLEVRRLFDRAKDSQEAFLVVLVKVIERIQEVPWQVQRLRIDADRQCRRTFWILFDRLPVAEPGSGSITYCTNQ